VLILATFAAAAYGPALSLPFIGDDYVFLDKTRDAGFLDLWSFRNVSFGWYRPWSRELHFWVLQHVAGYREIVFRLFGVALWIVALSLYASVVRRLASTRTAVVATLGVATLALWGTPLLWISGSQDLWMLCFALASVLLFVDGHGWWALLPFALALLSKETAAVLPAILTSCSVLVGRRPVAQAFRRTAHFWVLLVAWLSVHPTLRERLSSHQVTPETLHRPSSPIIVVKTLLSTLNLDAIAHPREVTVGDVLRVLASVAIVAVGVAALARLGGDAISEPERTSTGGGRRLAGFAVIWSLLGWFPLLLPSIQWHAYYGCLGALGAWFGLGLWLQKHPRLAVAAIAALAILRGAQASTPSWDWGTEWYQSRAGNMLSSIRSELLRLHPTLPPHSRVFLGHIPNNIGLIAGNSPALRVWYRDSTLQANFYSDYRPRASSSASGEDFFFHFDSLRGMVEVKAGTEDVGRAQSQDLEWEGNHENLAMLFLKSGDVPRAAVEFEKLSLLPRRPDAAGYAAVCWEFARDTSRAESLATAAGSRMKLSHPELQRWMGGLRQSFPGR
jgi:hypothetical protein